jgi:pre-mRNA-splicing factor SYF2
MPPAKKRKTANSKKAKAVPEKQVEEETMPAPEPAPEQTADKEPSPPPAATEEASSSAAPAPAVAQAPTTTAQDRLAKFRALQARAKASSNQNLKEATKESQRLATDPSQLTALNRKHAIVSHKLLKADTEEAGEDFERKRAWDWTIEESELWD